MNKMKENKPKEAQGIKKKVKKEKKEQLIKAPIAQSISFTTRRPKIINDGTRYCVKHRELIAEISGSIGFSIQGNFVINPGFSTSFPWLSPIANQWEQYRFKELSFHYIGRCPTTFAGSIMMVPEYDILDADPSNKIQASTYIGAIEQSPWTNFTCRLDPRALQPLGPKKYVRSGPVLGDLKTYDGGKFLIISQGQSDSSVCGDLWVEYDLELYVPQSGTAQAGASSSSVVSMFTNLSQNPGVSGTLQFTTTAQNPLSIGYSSGIFTPLSGTYRIDLCIGTVSGAGTSINAYFNGVALTYGALTIPNGSNGYFSLIQAFNGTDTFHLLNSASTTLVDSGVIFTLV